MISCKHLDDLLFEGDPESLAMAARHAEHCAACAEGLAAWNEISDTARSMKVEWQSDLLWPRIERAVRQEADRRRPRRRYFEVAAGIVLMIGLGVLMAMALQVRRDERRFNEVILKEEVLNQVENAEKTYLDAINRLEKSADPKLDDPSTPLMVSYKEKLMLLDDAIDECQKNIKLNRQNAHLRRQLLAIYEEKKATLKDVLREEANGSQQQ